MERLVHYVCAKARAVEMCNLLGDWRMAAAQMWAVAQGNRRCKTTIYHVAISWPETEQPTDDQAIEAGRMALAELGLTEHQAVIAVHRDRTNTHVHVVVNRIHPGTLRTMSTSHDYAKLERACRRIEAEQGWSADRGRFDVEVTEEVDGPVMTLVPKPQDRWDTVQADRAAGRRAPSRNVHHERQTGVVPLGEALSQAWKTRIVAAMDEAATWAELYMALADLGLRYAPFGSGARITQLGSDAVLKPSDFGKRFALKQMQQRLGPWCAADVEPENDCPACPTDRPRILRAAPGQVETTLTRSQTFKRTLMERTYVAITLSDDLVRAVRRVDLDGVPPVVTLHDASVIVDEGSRITASASDDDEVQARLMVAMAVAKGWTECDVAGEPAFLRAVAQAAAEAGLLLPDLPEEIAASVGKERAARETRPASPVAPVPPRPVHAAVDAVRTEAEAARAAEHAARVELAARQAADREDLAELVGDARDPVAQALRIGLNRHHADERRQQREKRPQRPTVPIVPLSAQDRRRRAAQRAEDEFAASDALIAMPHLPDAARSPFDHTACRRLWLAWDVRTEMATGRTRSEIEVLGADDPARDLRVLKGGTLLFAHRDGAGNIVGFERAGMADDGTFESDFAAGGQRTVLVLGNAATAARVVVTLWAIDAQMLMQAENREDTLYVSVGGEIGRHGGDRLNALLKDRDILVGGRPQDAASLAVALRDLLQDAALIGRIDEGTHEPWPADETPGREGADVDVTSKAGKADGRADRNQDEDGVAVDPEEDLETTDGVEDPFEAKADRTAKVLVDPGPDDAETSADPLPDERPESLDP
ncbi:relaxase/mobilization nuclease domain-containing protein [Salipiger sp. IMCC34102]|uniref:relaxase/mobilization nuclease domain-containing protein n=1 Tax=Salipiger sp. IMCC34102 TaxID=2510647 RepID=UPI002106C40F|nr:relaxase/mobilization nuclease domain-containing protein [Salipiger sp. IMCC34102]